jgi:cell division septum initiation protein DivIVA
MAKEEENQPKIMTKPLPDILEELEAWHNENKALIEELRHLYSQLQEALEETTEATTEAHKAAAEAREAGVKAATEAKEAAARAREAALKAATDLAEALGSDIAEVRKIAAEARDTANLIGLALMTAADGTRITSVNLIEALKARYEFKK